MFATLLRRYLYKIPINMPRGMLNDSDPKGDKILYDARKNEMSLINFI